MTQVSSDMETIGYTIQYSRNADVCCQLESRLISTAWPSLTDMDHTLLSSHYALSFDEYACEGKVLHNSSDVHLKSSLISPPWEIRLLRQLFHVILSSRTLSEASYDHLAGEKFSKVSETQSHKVRRY
jgi:hypothetical protein